MKKYREGYTDIDHIINVLSNMEKEQYQNSKLMQTQECIYILALEIKKLQEKLRKYDKY